MISPGQPLYHLDQMIGTTLYEGARDDFDDCWAAAEAFVAHASEQLLVQLRSDIEEVFRTCPDQDERFRLFYLDYNFGNGDEFDAWLRAVDNRIQLALAGIHTEPLVDPDP